MGSAPPWHWPAYSFGASTPPRPLDPALRGAPGHALGPPVETHHPIEATSPADAATHPPKRGRPRSLSSSLPAPPHVLAASGTQSHKRFYALSPTPRVRTSVRLGARPEPLWFGSRRRVERCEPRALPRAEPAVASGAEMRTCGDLFLPSSPQPS